MKKVKYNDTYIYVDNSPLDESETGKLNRNVDISELEKTSEYDLNEIKPPIMSDLWEDKDE